MIRLNEPLWRIRNVNDTDCGYISHSNLHIRSSFYAEYSSQFTLEKGTFEMILKILFQNKTKQGSVE